MPLSQLPAQLIPSNLLPSQLVAKWLPALAHGFEPAPQALVTPRLRLLRRVGDERPGSVWVADHLALATPVEVTFAEVDPGAPPETQAGALALRAQSFQSRTEATALINEPHLVSIIEHGDVRGLPFIVTELLEGKGMRQRLLHGPAKLGEVQTIVQQASGALAKAHSLGIAHGRLRPDNIYLTELAQKPFLKLDGFGELADDAAAQHPYYSPEQIMLGTGNDARADLWCFAVSLYELLTTTLPFEAPTHDGVAVAICNGEFARTTLYRADLPPAVDAWFAKALAKDPAARFADATELGRAFIAALANEAFASSPSMVPSAMAASVSPAMPALPSVLPPGMPPLPSVLPPGMPPMPVNATMSAPLPSFPPPPFPSATQSTVSAPPPLRAGHGARPDELPLELADGDDDDEKTVQWEVEERAPAAEVNASSSVSSLPVALPSLASRLPMLPLPAPLSPAALSSVALPSTSSQRASAGPLGSPPHLEPSVYLDSPYMASVASALAVPIHGISPSEPAPPQPARWWQFTADKTWLAALAFAAGVALTWFVYEPPSDDAPGAEVAHTEREPSVIRTLSVDDLPRAPGEEAELPKIVRSSQLPAADEEPLVANASAPAPAPVERRAVQRVQALAPAPARATSKPAAPPPAQQAQAQPTPPRATKAASEPRGNCSPPYYFDDKGIQRIKTGCLNGSGMIAGPFGASVPVAAKSAPAAAPSAPAPKSSSSKPAAGACDPPYYFEGKIRRLKLECL
jgi:serine/threonine-protein kinase